MSTNKLQFVCLRRDHKVINGWHAAHLPYVDLSDSSLTTYYDNVSIAINRNNKMYSYFIEKWNTVENDNSYTIKQII